MKNKIGLYGIKLGMTTVWDKNKFIPVTALKILDFMAIKAMGKFTKVAITTSFRRFSKPELGQIKQSTTENIPVKGYLREINAEAAQKGIELFKEGEYVDIRAKTQGHGFQGVMKRHGFAGGRASHGENKAHRTPGSTGQQNTERVFKNKKMAGRMGFDNVTMQNLKIISVRSKEGIILVKGATPGKNGFSSKQLSFISLAIKKERKCQ